MRASVQNQLKRKGYCNDFNSPSCGNGKIATFLSLTLSVTTTQPFKITSNHCKSSINMSEIIFAKQLSAAVLES